MAKETKKTEEQAAQGGKKQAQEAEFAEAGGGTASGAGASLDILLDMDVPVTVSIGHSQMTVRQLLQLGSGSVLKLDKPINEPADLYLKGRKFASGKVVVVDGQFAVRIERITGAGVPDAAGAGV